MRKIPETSIKELLTIASKKNLKIFTSFQSIHDIIDNFSAKLIASFCDRFFFTSSCFQLRDLVASLLLEAKASTNNNGYVINSFKYDDVPYILESILPKKDIYFLGPKTQGFVGKEL